MPASLFQVLNISRQDMLARMQDMDVVSNNIANFNTSGFKESRVNFQELLGAAEKGGTQVRSTQILSDQGTIQTTSNPLDLAIQGEGYFSVKLPDGTIGYTRDGRFSLDGQNKIVNASGFPLIWSGTIPADAAEVQVDQTGAVSANIGATRQQLGVINLTAFPNASALTINGQNILVANTISGAGKTGAPGSSGYGTVASNSIEQSNVNMADQMAHLITIQRAFQISSRTFQQTDTMINEAIHVRRA